MCNKVQMGNRVQAIWLWPLCWGQWCVIEVSSASWPGGLGLAASHREAGRAARQWQLQTVCTRLLQELPELTLEDAVVMPGSQDFGRRGQGLEGGAWKPGLGVRQQGEVGWRWLRSYKLCVPAKCGAAGQSHVIPIKLKDSKGRPKNNDLQPSPFRQAVDLPPKTRSSENEPDGKSKKRKINVPGALPSGSKTDGDKEPIAEEDFFEPSNLNPLNHEAHLAGSGNLGAVMLVVTVGEGAYLQNTHAEPITIRKWTTLPGYYKGKLWAPAGKEKEEIGPADVLFSLEGSQDYIILGGKYMSLLDTIKTKRSLSPSDAHVGCHTLTDSPSATEPAAFTLSPKQAQVYFKASDFPAKVGKTEGAEAGQDDVAKIPAAHMAGTLPPSKWNGKYIKMRWAMKWPPVAAKGLQPIRPMVVNSVSLTIPPGKALQIVKPDS